MLMKRCGISHVQEKKYIARMHIKFTNTDSNGYAVTRELSVMFDGDRYEIPVSENGTANVPRELGEYLVNEERYSIEKNEAYDEDVADGAVDGDDPDEPVEVSVSEDPFSEASDGEDESADE